jgi:hypothetical protein
LGDQDVGEIQSFSLPPENALDLDAPRGASEEARISGAFGELDLSAEVPAQGGKAANDFAESSAHTASSQS